MRDFKIMSERFNAMGLTISPAHGQQQATAAKSAVDRSNFLNSNYVLFQLLRKNGHACEFSSFYCLRTPTSRIMHDNICERIFADLGWPFTPTV